MTVAALTPSISYAENGVTLAFAVPFRFDPAGGLLVKRIATDGTVTTVPYGAGWSATGGATDAGGTLNLVATVAGATLTIDRVTARAQQTDYTTNDRFPAETHEAALDRAMLIDQEQDAAQGKLAERALRVPDGETVNLIPAKAARLGKGLAFDGVTGQPIVVDVPTTALSQAQAAAAQAIAAQAAAESARDATLTAYDQFDDRYLGAKAADPTLDNDGNALVGGTLYFNTASGEMRIWTGPAWVSAYVSGGSYALISGAAFTGAISAPSLTLAGNLAAGGTISPGNVGSLFLQGTASQAAFSFDANDYMAFDRTTNALAFVIGGTTMQALDVNGDLTSPARPAAVGYKGIPFLPGASTAYTFVLADASKCKPLTTGGWIIPANAAVAYPVGTLLAGYNDSGASQTVAITTDTLRLEGSATVGTRSVAQRSAWRALKVNSTEWIISGAGVS